MASLSLWNGGLLLLLLALAQQAQSFHPVALGVGSGRAASSQRLALRASSSEEQRRPQARELAAVAAALLVALPGAGLAAAPAELIPEKIGGTNVNDALCKSGVFTNAFQFRCTNLGNLEKVAQEGRELDTKGKGTASKLEEKLAAKKAAREAAAAAAAAA
eukprot:CAMPEP_0173431520 /NCGR_PEP_ID=MMETSP1357-20121228/9639_1 /TAXON_ID=77926 /ORGANISM="Hemiselmis rufescens, Strain PCC563" /LENGTH=160 /DNA_ID=CAMNT_0014396009 /DNA_START=146 /DNA_END=624 /DNA_ORIENTATION=-